jgi:imidazolonepropionase-like amidohydrolase
VKQLPIADRRSRILESHTPRSGTRNWLRMVLAAVLGIAIWPGQYHVQAGGRAGAQAGNQPAIGNPQSVIVLQGGTLFDGTGAPPLGDAVVVIRGDRIVAVGRRGEVAMPAGARVLSTAGRTVLPGFIDLHFHFDLHRHPGLPVAFLLNGITTVRDMGNWIEHDQEVLKKLRAYGLPLPRFLMSGPLLDGPDPAHPREAIVLLDRMDAEREANRLIDAGASSLKVYFRLPLSLMKTVMEVAHRRGVHVTGHLEIVDVREAVNLGLDGIEHVTSVGLALLPPPEAERYRQAVLKNNEARRKGRYEIWEKVDVSSPQAQELIRFLVARGVYLDPTIAVFEIPRRSLTDRQPRSVRNMAAFAVAFQRAGGRLVVGSHGSVPNAETGFAFHRELEVYVEAGLSPAQALVAATRAGAEALRLDDVGTIRPGKIADIVVVAGDPLTNIRDTRKIKLVIREGMVLDRAQVANRLRTLGE